MTIDVQLGLGPEPAQFPFPPPAQLRRLIMSLLSKTAEVVDKPVIGGESGEGRAALSRSCPSVLWKGGSDRPSASPHGIWCVCLLPLAMPGAHPGRGRPEDTPARNSMCTMNPAHVHTHLCGPLVQVANVNARHGWWQCVWNSF
eukprot:1151182-Pelagomonas_calceolata.AAC.6